MVSIVRLAFKKSYYDYLHNKATPYGLAGEALFSFVTFRLVSKNNVFWIDLSKVLKDIVSKFRKENKYKQYNNNTSVAILDTDFKWEHLRVDYTQASLKLNPHYFFSKEELLISDCFMYNVKMITFIFYFYFKILFFNKTKGLKINYALCLKELIECSCLLHFIKKNNITTLIDFANYEVDSNLLYLLLKEQGVTVYKVPSPGPLFIHNSILLSDYLVVTSGYQLEELSHLKNIKVNYLIKSIPEMGYDYLDKYLKKSQSNNDNAYTLGYYSHASWLRKKQKHADNGLNLENAEEETLKIIDAFLLKKSNYKLTVFLHPREKTIDSKEVYRYYTEIFKSKNIEFAPKEISTANSFDNVNIAILALSTILFERLFVKRKVLICKKNIQSFPHPTSSLNHICFETVGELENLIVQASHLNNDEFYNNFQINNHTYEQFNNPLPTAFAN